MSCCGAEMEGENVRKKNVKVKETLPPEDSQSDEGKMMNGEEVRSEVNALPEELVEMILAMVPFPYVFKARLLSKAWLARLSPISSLEGDDAKKSLTRAFQNRMGEWFAKWKTFCPVAYCNENLMGYDRASRTWQRLPSLSFLPKEVLTGLKCFRDTTPTSPNLQIDGALVLVSTDGLHLYVANILTRTWKQLPPCPHEYSEYWVSPPPRERYREELYHQKKLVSQSSDKYTVITMFYYGDGFNHLIQIYDSTWSAWSSKKVVLSKDYHSRVPVSYLDGALYMGVYKSRLETTVQNSNLKVPALNIEEETLDDLNISVEGLAVPKGFPALRKDHYWQDVTLCLMACNADLLMMASSNRFSQERPLQVLRVDLGSQKLVEFASVPKHALRKLVEGYLYYSPVTDGDCIFFGVIYDCHRVVSYNIHDDEWTSFPFVGDMCRATTSSDQCFPARKGEEVYQWICCPFRPSLNPFASV